MAIDRFVIAMIAETMYKEDLAKRLGLNPNSEYGRKKLNEYLEEERKSDELSAKNHLHNSNPGKFLSYTEIRSEAAKIRKKRLEPYVQQAKVIHEKRKQDEKQEQSVSNSDVIASQGGSLLAQITYEQENQEIDSAINTLNSIYQEQETQDNSMNETENDNVAPKKQEMYQEAKTNKDKQKEMKFVLFYPVSICITTCMSGECFKYGIKDGMYYPCLLGFISEDNKCVEVISGREFNIISEEDYCHGYVKITNDSKVVANPVVVCRTIDNSSKNLHLIKKYIDVKGNLSQSIISQYCDFNHRLNRLLFNQNTGLSFTGIELEQGFYDSFNKFKIAKRRLQEIDIENLKALKEIAYIQSGKKVSDDLIEKNNIIMCLRKKLTPPKR